MRLQRYVKKFIQVFRVFSANILISHENLRGLCFCCVKKTLRKELENDNNLIKRKNAKKGFQTEDDNNFTDRTPLTRDFGVLKEYGSSYSYFWDVLTVYFSKDLKFVGSMNKIIHSITVSSSGWCLNSSNWINNYHASYKVCVIHNVHEEVFLRSHCVPSQEYEIPRKPPWFVAIFLLCGSLRRRKRKGDTTTHSIPCPATTIMEKVLSQKGEGLQMLLTAYVLGIVSFQIESFKEGADSIYILNLGKTLEKLMMASRVLASMDNPQDLIVQSTSRPYEQRDVLRFSHYSGAQKLAGRHTQDTFTNRMPKCFTEPCPLIPNDTRTGCQPIKVDALNSYLIDEPGGIITARLNSDALFCIRKSSKILVAMFTVSRRSVNIFIYWVAMYNEAKLAFFIYWKETDRSLLEGRADVIFLHVQKASNGQMRAFGIMQYVATHSKGKPKPTQERNSAISRQSSILAQTFQSVPTLEDKLRKQHLQTNSKNEERNVPAEMEGLLEKLKQSSLSTNGLASEMTDFPRCTKEVTSPFKENGVSRLMKIVG
ncbi:hypothetical protein MKX03_018645 [Papaver bracteatum]|nr:hypothetical protein MKX03_018645 [Papaver bracteatum]